MVERYIAGRELTCAVMGGVALAVTEVVTDLNFYNYEAKYAQGGSKHIFPRGCFIEYLPNCAETSAKGT